MRTSTVAIIGHNNSDYVVFVHKSLCIIHNIWDLKDQLALHVNRTDPE